MLMPMTTLPPHLTPWPYPCWIAHRGAGTLAPENTLAAFRLGADHGFAMFECDVKLSADGEPFLLHDAELERTTNGQGAAGLLSWDALSRLDAGSWHGRAYAGEPLLRLEALARWLQGLGLMVNLEIKPTPGDDTRTGRVVAERVAAAINGGTETLSGPLVFLYRLLVPPPLIQAMLAPWLEALKAEAQL